MSKIADVSKDSLLQINQQQKYLIQILCDAYNSQTEKGKLYEIIRQYCLQQQNGHAILSKIDTAQEKADATFVDEAGKERIRELEEEIRKQDDLYAKLENQLREYNEQAKQFEDMLAQNEKEKAALLASFQKAADGSQSNSAIFHDLEVQRDELTAECEKLRKQNNDTKSLCHEVQSELVRSREDHKELERQVQAARQQLNDTINQYSDPDLKQQIEEQETIIEDLQKQIDDANEEINRLKRENQSLRDRLMHSD